MLLYIKKYWYVVLIGVLSVGGIVLRAIFSGKSTPPSLPPIDPPKKDAPVNFVEVLRQKKEENDKKIDKMSRKELIDSLNDEYKNKPTDGSGPAS